MCDAPHSALSSGSFVKESGRELDLKAQKRFETFQDMATAVLSTWWFIRKSLDQHEQEWDLAQTYTYLKTDIASRVRKEFEREIDSIGNRVKRLWSFACQQEFEGGRWRSNISQELSVQNVRKQIGEWAQTLTIEDDELRSLFENKLAPEDSMETSTLNMKGEGNMAESIDNSKLRLKNIRIEGSDVRSDVVLMCCELVRRLQCCDSIESLHIEEIKLQRGQSQFDLSVFPNLLHLRIGLSLRNVPEQAMTSNLRKIAQLHHLRSLHQDWASIKSKQMEIISKMGCLTSLSVRIVVTKQATAWIASST